MHSSYIYYYTFRVLLGEINSTKQAVHRFNEINSFPAHRSTHSFTTAKLPSPITFPTLYFSRIVEELENLFPFTPAGKQGR